MKTILVFDTETTGLDPQTARVIEAAGALWSVQQRTLVACFSFLVKADGNPCEAINRIPAAVLDEGLASDEAEKRLAIWFGRADAIVAHNASFDASFMPIGLRDMRPWICTRNDIEWPRAGVGRGLRDLAADHDVGVVRAHRAMSDVDILVRLFERVAELGHDVEAMLVRGLRPKAKFVSLAPFDQKDVVKSHGFTWEPAPRVWTRTMAIEDAKTLPFAVREVA